MLAVKLAILLALVHPAPHYFGGGVATSTINILPYAKTVSQVESSVDYTAVSQLPFIGMHTSGNLTYQITDVQSMPDGIQFYARAWQDGVQLGFGKDGTTDLERFKIHKPGTLLASSTGDIILSTSTPTVRYVEDPQTALLAELENTMKIAGKTGTKIVLGSIGHTTDTFFAGAGDGMVQASGSTSWATTHATASGITNDPTSAVNNTAGESYDGTHYEILRHFYPVDTSSLPSSSSLSESAPELPPSSSSSPPPD